MASSSYNDVLVLLYYIFSADWQNPILFHPKLTSFLPSSSADNKIPNSHLPGAGVRIAAHAKPQLQCVSAETATGAWSSPAASTKQQSDRWRGRAEWGWIRPADRESVVDREPAQQRAGEPNAQRYWVADGGGEEGWVKGAEGYDWNPEAWKLLLDSYWCCPMLIDD